MTGPDSGRDGTDQMLGGGCGYSHVSCPVSCKSWPHLNLMCSLREPAIAQPCQSSRCANHGNATIWRTHPNMIVECGVCVSMCVCVILGMSMHSMFGKVSNRTRMCQSTVGTVRPEISNNTSCRIMLHEQTSPGPGGISPCANACQSSGNKLCSNILEPPAGMCGWIMSAQCVGMWARPVCTPTRCLRRLVVHAAPVLGLRRPLGGY